MSLRERLASLLARDPRYSFQAYAFVIDALEHTKTLKRRSRDRARMRGRSLRTPKHVSGRELCEGARELALNHYGLLALAVLSQWGIRSTSDLGEIVYNLIASGDLEKAPEDSRADFDNVYDFEQAFRGNYQLMLDDVA